MDLSKERSFSSKYLFLWKFCFNLRVINISSDIPTTQMSIFILFVSTGVLSENDYSLWVPLSLSRRRPLSYRNQSIDLRSKSMDWFLYDNGLRLERVKFLRNNQKKFLPVSQLWIHTSFAFMTKQPRYVRFRCSPNNKYSTWLRNFKCPSSLRSQTIIKYFCSTKSLISQVISHWLNKLAEVLQNQMKKIVTRFCIMHPFYTPWKHQECFGGIKWEHWAEIG